MDHTAPAILELGLLLFESMAVLNITLQARNNWPWQHRWKLVGPPEE